MRTLFWGITLVVIGTVILLDNLGFVYVEDLISTYWPLLLVIWGLSILLRRRSEVKEKAASSVDPLSVDLLHESKVFGDLTVTVSSSSFKGGSVSTVFGDTHIDVSKVQLAEGEHEFRIHGAIGDTLIILPKDFAVSISASTFLGDLLILGQSKEGFSPDIHFSTPEYSTSSRRLKLVVSKVLGDVKII